MKTSIQIVVAVCLTAASLFGQSGNPVNQVAGPTPNNVVSLYYYNASNQIQYLCTAAAQQPPTTYTIGASPSFTQIVVATNVGTITFGATAAVWVGQRVTVAGMATSALNATYVITGVSGSTATITTSGVADGTYNTSGATISTTGPVLGASVWSIQVFTYSGGYLATNYYAGGGTTPQGQLACSSRASY